MAVPAGSEQTVVMFPFGAKVRVIRFRKNVARMPKTPAGELFAPAEVRAPGGRLPSVGWASAAGATWGQD
ncbi:MAG TPA: hypothetical protein DCR20_11020 [Planctomycetaceae bacterium]|nr:hypothetical protein [Planctomycetaceae bacterium]